MLVAISVFLSLSIFTILVFCLEYNNKTMLIIVPNKFDYQDLEVGYKFNQFVPEVDALKRERFPVSVYVKLEKLHLKINTIMCLRAVNTTL